MKPRKRKQPGTLRPIGNDILRALLGSEYSHLSADLRQVDLKAGQVIYTADQRIDHVYFPETAVVAMIDTVEGGGTVEVGIIGHEGMAGINIFLGGLVTPDKAVVQVAGTAMRMKTTDLRNAVRFGSPLQRLLLRYTQALLAVISQSVACSQHHAVTQRLARWLLTMHDYVSPEDVRMSQQFIAAMLGVRRATINESAGILQARGVVTCNRGRIRILDEAALRKASCECYRFIRRQYRGLHTEVPGFLSGNKGKASSRLR